MVLNTINTRWLANPIEVLATFLMIIEAPRNNLFIIRVKIYVLIKWLYSDFQE
jgi:hypothetical protein